MLDPDTETDAGWGTRTPGNYGSGEYADFFCKISVAGECYTAGKNKVYVRPCLVLPDDTLLDGDGRVTTGVIVPVKVDGVWCSSVSWCKQAGGPPASIKRWTVRGTNKEEHTWIN